MSTKKLIQAVCAFMAVAVVICLIIAESTTEGLNAFVYLDLLAKVVAFFAGVSYLYFNLSKNASVFYKIYMYAIAASISFFVLASTISNASQSVFSGIANVAMIGIYLVLVIGKDMGKLVNSILAIVLLVCSFVCLLVCSLDYGPLSDQFSALYVNSIALFFLNVCTSFIVLGKYVDKAERGRKL